MTMKIKKNTGEEEEKGVGKTKEIAGKMESF